MRAGTVAIWAAETFELHEEELKALAVHDKPKAIEHMFNRLLWLKVHEIMERLDPPASDDETVGDMLSRAKDAGDADAERLMNDEGRSQVMQEARIFVDGLLDEGGDQDRTVESYIHKD